MLRSETLFGKREPASGNTTPNSPMNASSAQPSVAKPGGPAPVGMPPSATPATAPGQSVSDTPEVSGGSKLIVGQKIKLKGEIADCDTLVVEGQVEATMESRVIQIAESGTFKGSVQVEVAEINGTFDGDLTARQKLVIHSTGKVTGTIRFGKIVIEEGGQLSGDVQVGLDGANRNNLSVAKAAV
ncbi:bactofilin family protein [Noviherbaspirillum pedocola]|uniref:Polymer-forming cytoskeletal protein n=1 Tax=Noviherbaspirillum pedocola TaxID=2801341 RepID=A0A934W7W8_9BURK|nr:polymer-forming cytoskeletal protein [Noviherbaspirillum pedocola]MBK4736870.1 polymer-forming cytoskeletal protein [Noviherbaspirillum pedocola]